MAASTELKGLGKLDPFQGDPSDLDCYFNDCHIFLDANETSYNNEKKKVIFMLTHLKGGNAERYKTLWMEQKKAAAATTGGDIDYGTTAQFTLNLQNAFKETNKKHNALYELRHIKQGSDTIDDFNNKFKLLVSQTKITDDLTLVDAYRDAIKPQIARQILMMENVPTTINNWYEKAATFDNNYHRLTNQIGKFKPKNSSHKPGFKFKMIEKDPNAMDIDALSPQEQKGLKEQGRYLFCKEKGHYARNCPK